MKKIILFILIALASLTVAAQSSLTCSNCTNAVAPAMLTFNVNTSFSNTPTYIVNYTWKVVKNPNIWTWYSNFGTITPMFATKGSYKVYAIVQYVRRSTGTVVSTQVTNTINVLIL